MPRLPTIVLLLSTGCFSEPVLGEYSATDGSSSSGVTDSRTAGESEASSASTSTSAGSSSSTGSSTDPADTMSSSNSSSSDTVEPEPSCPFRSHDCVPQAPLTWAGPVLFVESSTSEAEPPCDDAFPDLVFSRSFDLSAEPAACGCSCNSPASVTCPSATLRRYNSNDCSGSPTHTSTVNSTCTNVSNGLTGNRLATASLPASAQCSAVPSVQIPEAAFQSRVTACAPAEVSECDDGSQCLPLPNDGRLCVYAPGELDCPDGEYQDRSVYYATYDDTRQCSTCTCTDPQGHCTGQVLLYDSPCGQAFMSSTSINAGSCSTLAFAPARAFWNQTGFTATCNSQGGAPVGAAVPTEPVTACCR